ncbi:MAG: hypothetical protein DRI61_05205 [Chloroflexi bacterium]|nr:MAG: hypothetical protein DRI61_05205 [Chloroflexota bacterium]
MVYVQPEPMPPHGHDVVGIRVNSGKALPEPVYQGIYGLLGHTLFIGIGPDVAGYLFTADYTPCRFVEKFQQPELGGGKRRC